MFVLLSTVMDRAICSIPSIWSLLGVDDDYGDWINRVRDGRKDGRVPTVITLTFVSAI